MLVSIRKPSGNYVDPFPLKNNLNKLLDTAFNTMRTPLCLSSLQLKSSLADNGDSLVYNVEIPGVKKEDIKLSTQNDILSISGERNTPGYSVKSQIIRSERCFGNFNKIIKLPCEVEADKTNAEYADGILKIVLQKSERAKPKEISIK